MRASGSRTRRVGGEREREREAEAAGRSGEETRSRGTERERGVINTHSHAVPRIPQFPWELTFTHASVHGCCRPNEIVQKSESVSRRPPCARERLIIPFHAQSAQRISKGMTWHEITVPHLKKRDALLRCSDIERAFAFVLKTILQSLRIMKSIN